MKKLLPVLAGALIAAGWAIVPASAQTIPVSPNVAAPAAPAADAVAPFIQSIQQATDPSALITAYANGFAVDRTSIKLHEAYISRMIDFGMPEMAYHQAELAATLDPRNGLVRGVLAYVNAKRGLMPEALSEIVQAASLSPDQPFVQRTAGELLAWYDRNFLDLKIADATKVALDTTRTALASRAPFAQAYEEARKALADQAAAAGKTAASASPSSAAPAPTSQSMAQDTLTTGSAYAEIQPGTYVYPVGGGYSYVQPQDYVPLYNPDYYGWTSDWWYPSGVFFGGGPFFAFFGNHHHHDRDFDDHHGHDFDGDGGKWAEHHPHLFAPALNAQQQLHRAVASVKPLGTGHAGPGAGFASIASGNTIHGHGDAFGVEVAHAGGAGGASPGGTVFLAVNGRVIDSAHGSRGNAAFTSGNLEPPSLQTVHSSARGPDSTLRAANSSSMVTGTAGSLPPGVNPPHVMSGGSVFTGTVSSSSFGVHGTHVVSSGSVVTGTSHSSSFAAHETHGIPSGSGGGGARFTALPGGRVSFAPSGGHFASGLGGGGTGFAGSAGGHVSVAPGSGHFTSSFSSGAHEGGHAGGGHR